MNEEILENCIKAVKIGEKLGCNQVECFTSITDSINISVKKGEIKIAKKIVDGGLGVRCVVNNAIGFSYLTNPNEIEKCVTKAFKQARSAPDQLRAILNLKALQKKENISMFMVFLMKMLLI